MKWVALAGMASVAVVLMIFLIGALLPKEHVASRSVVLHKPVSQVWNVLTGPPDWHPSVERYERLAPVEGHRTWKEFDGRRFITYVEVDSVPDSRWVTKISGDGLPYGGTWVHELSPDEEGCQLKITEHGEVYNPFFRFMSRFVLGHTATIDAYLKALRGKLGDG